MTRRAEVIESNKVGKAAALEGMLVLDFSHAAAGPFASMLLGDLGARVIKVEKPGRGDGARHMSMTSEYSNPFIGGDYFLGLNRNKESVALDISQPRGREIALNLAKQADIVIENMRPGVMDRLGLGARQLREIDPELIYCSISAFGTAGPLAGEPGMDIVAQARSGVIAITGEADGPPVRPGVSLSDLSCGLQATIGVLAAVVARKNGAGGQVVSVSLLDSTLMMMANYAVALLNTETQLERVGSGHPQLAPYQAYATRDGWVFIGCGTNLLWRRLCRLLDLETIEDHPLFETNALRAANRTQLNEYLQPRLATETTEQWLKRFSEAGIPGSPIVSPSESFAQEMRWGSPVVEKVRHPILGDLLLPGISINLDETPASVRTAPPWLGQHSREILTDVLGLDPEEVENLVSEGLVTLGEQL